MANIVTPFGDLIWCGVNGDTTAPNKYFDENNTKIEASIVLEGEEAQAFHQTLDAIVNEGLSALVEAEPDPAKKEKIWAKKYVPGTPGETPGTMTFKFKSPRPPSLYDADGNKAPAGDNWLIGNGSRGRFSIGTGRAYASPIVSGVGLFLNQIQITELVPPSAKEDGFDPAPGGGFSAASTFGADSSPAPVASTAPTAAPPPNVNYATPPAAPPSAPVNAELVTNSADFAKYTEALRGLSG